MIGQDPSAVHLHAPVTTNTPEQDKPSPGKTAEAHLNLEKNMATPLSASAFLKALRAEGVNVVEVGEWETHNRNHKGDWGPLNGVMIHHTASSGTRDSVATCRTGHGALPGPLCHGVIAKDGTVHLVGWGRANHA